MGDGISGFLDTTVFVPLSVRIGAWAAQNFRAPDAQRPRKYNYSGLLLRDHTGTEEDPGFENGRHATLGHTLVVACESLPQPVTRTSTNHIRTDVPLYSVLDSLSYLSLAARSLGWNKYEVCSPLAGSCLSGPHHMFCYPCNLRQRGDTGLKSSTGGIWRLSVRLRVDLRSSTICGVYAVHLCPTTERHCRLIESRHLR